MNQDNQKILVVDIEREMKKSYIDYSMSVIVGRALPDVRDGLKPVHRRVLYTMYEEGITPDKPYHKSAATVGNVLAKYHPHGDAAVYDTLVRMAQDFSLRYPLVDGHGNFGSVDGDAAAAQRYTEARMSKLSMELLKDIEKETVNYAPSYDNRRKEPVVLPSKYPNLLVNGSAGIAVGMATNIPPHNIGEIIDATVCLIDNPDAGFETLMQHVKGPDFPTGGIILGMSGIRAAYATGKGHIRVRARAGFEEFGQNRIKIVVTEIPYMVNKARLIENIAELVKDKRLEGISDLRDESDREGMRIVIELKRDANPQVVLNQLYNYTQMQDTFAVNMLALDKNQPKIMNLKEVLGHFIDHQKDVIVRRTRYELRKAGERAHILEGLIIAVDNVDEVIAIIRASENIPEAKRALMERFADVEVGNLLDRTDLNDAFSGKGLSDEQATAIVNLRFGQLTGLERAKITGEHAELMGKIRRFMDILASNELVNSIIKEEMLAVKDKFNDARRTEITQMQDEIDIEDLIKEEDCVYTLTGFGYIKRLPVDTYRSQKRGGRGITGMGTREEDAVDTLFVGSTHDNLLFFTTKGRLYRLKGYQIPESGRTAKGTNIINLLQIEQDERVTAMIPVRSFEEGKYLFMATRSGTVKRATLESMVSARKAGIRAINLEEGDELIAVKLTEGEDEIILATREGRAIRFRETDVRPMGREAGGVRGIRLEDDDYCIGTAQVSEGRFILSVTENGYGKCTPVEEYPCHNRGGKGVLNYNITAKTGSVACIKTVNMTEDLMLITDGGVIIRLPIEEIRVCARATQGVILMKTAEGVHVISLATVSSIYGEDEENDADSQTENSQE